MTGAALTTSAGGLQAFWESMMGASQGEPTKTMLRFYRQCAEEGKRFLGAKNSCNPTTLPSLEARMELRGIIPPVATPMQANEDLDLPRLRWFLDHLIDAGVHGIFVLGTNSEFYALDETEKHEVIATAVEHVRGRVPVFAGTGAETTREAVRLTRMAEREGVQGVSVITPYFIAPSQQEIFDHYRRIAECTALPVMLYNNPGTCGGVKIDVDTVARLAQIPNIIGVKDSSGDLQNTCELIRAVPPRFSVLIGRDTLILHALVSGARCALAATASSAPRR